MISQSSVRYLSVLVFAFIAVGISGMLAITGLVIGDISTETVESANDVGKYSSIALDSNGYVHISYIDETNDDLRYCNNTQGSWTCDIVASYGTNFYESSIAIDSSDKLHIAYLVYNDDEGEHYAVYCNNTQGSWTCNNIRSATTLFRDISIAIDSNDKIHLAISVNINDYVGLYYYNNTNGAWAGDPFLYSPGSCAACIEFTSVAIDSNNKIHMSLPYITSDLRYCNNTQGSWTCDDIDTANDVGKYSSIAIDSNDKMHIAHYDETNGNLRYCNNTQGSWTCQAIETSGIIGLYPSIAIDGNDKVHIVHYDATNDVLRYCNNTVGTWSCTSLAKTDGNSLGWPNGRALAIKQGRIVDSSSFSDKVHTSWYNVTDLLYSTYEIGSTGDSTAPIITAHNLTAEYPTNISVLFNFTDATATDTMSINDTTNFQINKTGFLWNITDLIPAVYWLTISANDSYNNTGNVEIWINITDTTAPVISAYNLSVTHPENVSVLFNFTDYAATDTMHINDTTNFEMNKTGFLFNISYLTPLISFRRYWLNITANDSFNNTGSVEIWINITDTTDPTITTHNLSVTHPNNVSGLFNFTDNYMTGTMHINDTTNFEMNKTGSLINISFLGAGEHWLNITANDTMNNTADVEIWVNVSSTTSTTTTVVTETTESLGSGVTTTVETTETTEETTSTIETTETTETTEVAEENILDSILNLINLDQPKSAVKFVESFDSKTVADFRSADVKGISNMTLKCSLEQITANISEFEYVDEVNCENSIICRWIREMQKKNVTEECRLVITNADGFVSEKAFDILKIGHPEPVGLTGEKVIFGLRLSRDWPWLFLLLIVIIYLIIRLLRYVKKKRIKLIQFFKR